MSMIEDFIARYTKEYDFYDQAGRVAGRLLEGYLQEEGILAIITSRPKSISRLKDKCLQREKKNGVYASVDEIFGDIKDLSGVRVALYFPGERGRVEGLIKRSFHATDPRTKFEPAPNDFYSRRCSGYSATHYTIHLKEQDLSDQDKRYATARIEIQIASVLMHAWSEVEHDLVHKPLDGNLSPEEHAALDQLNGLVLAREMALETLQKAQQARVALKGKRIATRYDLAVHLLSRAEGITEDPVNEAGLGRVDLLFDLISQLQIDTAEKLSPYLEALHGNLELRPLSEQIIDSLLAEDPTSSSDAPAAASARIFSVPSRSSSGSLRSHPAISAAQESDTSPVPRALVTPAGRRVSRVRSRRPAAGEPSWPGRPGHGRRRAAGRRGGRGSRRYLLRRSRPIPASCTW
jgi:ppGpp synthetase/RelA/SpoT-type nucleotidyltranferase